MDTTTRIGSRHAVQWRGLWILAFAFCCCPQLLAEHYTIAGCVTDGARSPVGRAKVIAWQVDGTGQHTGKAETDKSSGCYEIHHVPSGIYFISLKDERFAFEHVGPTQAEVRINSENADRVDLTTELPDAGMLRVGIARVC